MTQRLTRRVFITYAAATGGAVVAAQMTMPLAAAPIIQCESERPVTHACEPILSFHLDRPYVDYSGTAEPWRPPRGLRSGAAIAGLSEEELRSLVGYL
ncbi:MAG TPA: twin-arginine translocation signal domain-containing protein [Steroidobacteraceae bacterium]